MKAHDLVEVILTSSDKKEIMKLWQEISSTCSFKEQIWAHQIVSKKLIAAITNSL